MNTTSTGAKAPHPEMAPGKRRLAGGPVVAIVQWSLAAAILAAIALLRTGEIAADRGDYEFAFSLPGSVSVAGPLILKSDTAVGTASEEEVARKTLASDPFDGTAVTFLANAAQSRGDDAQLATLDDVAENMGWRDPQIQRMLYNKAYMRGDYPAAMLRADALLKQDLASQELFGHFTQELGDRDFRHALVRQLAQPSSWREAYLDHAADRAPTGAMLTLLKDGSALPGFPVKAAADRAAKRLIERGDFRQSIVAARLAGENPGSIAAWPDPNKDAASSRFAWDLGNAGRVEDGRLRMIGNGRSQRATITLALAPGRYEMQTRDGPLANPRPVEWDLICAGPTSGPVERWGRDGFVIDGGCIIQRLSIRAGYGRVGQGRGDARSVAPLRAVPR